MKTTPTPFGKVRLILPHLLPPAASAQTISRLALEQSTDLLDWRPAPVSAGMLDADGRILVPSDTAERFHRMRVSAEAEKARGIPSIPSVGMPW